MDTENPQTIYVRITEPENGCFSIVHFDLELTSPPETQPIPDLEICATENLSIDLTQQANFLLENQPEDQLAYFKTESDAENNANPIQDPEDFTNTENPQTIYVRIFNPNSPDCYAVASFMIKTNPSPIIDENLQLESCSATIDLTKIADQLQNELILSYYASETDAENGSNAIDDPENYLFSTGEIIYFRAQNNAGCSAVAKLGLKKGVCELPQGISPNGDGQNDSFDLSSLTASSQGGDLKVFSRYGRKVYEKNDYSKEWEGQDMNGNKLPTGTYFYVLQLNKRNPKFGRTIKRWVYLQRQSGM